RRTGPAARVPPPPPAHRSAPLAVVAARAPRKVLGSGCARAGPSRGGANGPAGGHAACARPTPAWQRGIAEFLRSGPRPGACPEPREAAGSDGGEAAGESGRALAVAPSPLPAGAAGDGSPPEPPRRPDCGVWKRVIPFFCTERTPSASAAMGLNQN
uniref:PCNA-associated factor n=1 Tax=Nothoprocta perdicaria TaxID=30464 RepID=A0A8C6Z8D8_NOTPE